MNKTFSLYWWFSFDLYYLILDGTDNILRSLVKTSLCTLWGLALAKKSYNSINNSCACFRTIFFLVTKFSNSNPSEIHETVSEV